tara:strand:- start:14272 stop:14619 length:348 start_codon:yes stop_codon:yes gene_type:complete
MKAENRIQQECVQDFRNKYCRVGCVPRYCIFSVPNETKDMRELMTKKQTGLMAGASDLIIVGPGVVLFLECKDLNGKQSEGQKIFEEIVSELRHVYRVFRSLDEFNSIINEHLFV